MPVNTSNNDTDGSAGTDSPAPASIETQLNTVITGDLFDEITELPDNTVHAVITDPPYGLAFIKGEAWDDFDPREYQDFCERWAREVKRVLKPGGHLIAFSGNRTHHRMFTGVEDAGFTIRDTLTWHFAEGMPKGLNVSKSIDKQAGADREVVGTNPHYSENRDHDGFTDSDTFVATGTDEQRHTTKKHKTKPATDVAETWQGWKTQLKPATEFAVLARKPLGEDTVAENIMEHGTGALNIDSARIETTDTWSGSEHPDADTGNVLHGSKSGELNTQSSASHHDGRFPSNVAFDEVEAERLDAVVGELDAGAHTPTSDERNIYSNGDTPSSPEERVELDLGGPSRYFYTSKATRNERTLNGKINNPHPTVKPVDLMEWLVKLVTAENQRVLDPFTGSGTTLLAAKHLNRDFIGIEQNPEYADIARARAGLTLDDPSNVRDHDDNQTGLTEFTNKT